MAGLTDQGLTVNRLEDVVTDLNTQANTIFQDLVPPGDTVDTSESSTIGRIVGLNAASMADVWEAIEQVHNAFNPNAATGVALDNLVFIGGLTRFDSEPSTAYELLRGDYLTSIPSGQYISSLSTSVRFITESIIVLNNVDIAEATLSLSSVSNSTLYRVVVVSDAATRTISYTSDSSASQSEILNGIAAAVTSVAGSLFTSSIDTGTITLSSINKLTKWTFTLTGPLSYAKIGKVVGVVAEEDGPVEQPVDTITTIQTPVLGWDSATNPSAAVVGRDRESDEDLRLRFRLSKYIRGSNISDALYSDLLALAGVEAAKVLVNDTESTDGNGIPAHGFMAVVLGGISSDIGNTVWENKPVGIITHGDVTESIVDSQGETQSVKFKRPTETPIYINLEITDTGEYPDNGDALIKEALVSYFKTNFSIGDDVIYSRLYSPINSVTGHYVTTLEVGTSPSPSGTSNISINDISVATLEAANITITVS